VLAFLLPQTDTRYDAQADRHRHALMVTPGAVETGDGGEAASPEAEASRDTGTLVAKLREAGVRRPRGGELRMRWL